MNRNTILVIERQAEAAFLDELDEIMTAIDAQVRILSDIRLSQDLENDFPYKEDGYTQGGFDRALQMLCRNLTATVHRHRTRHLKYEDRIDDLLPRQLVGMFLVKAVRPDTSAMMPAWRMYAAFYVWCKREAGMHIAEMLTRAQFEEAVQNTDYRLVRRDGGRFYEGAALNDEYAALVKDLDALAGLPDRKDAEKR